MRNPASGVRASSRSTNASYGVSRRAWSKWTTTVVSTPAAAEPLEPLVRVAQERRRAAGEHLVGMVVEGDDDRARARRRRLAHEVLEQVRMAAGAGRRTRRRRRTRATPTPRSRPGRSTTRTVRRPRSPPRSAPAARRRVRRGIAPRSSPGARRAPCAGTAPQRRTGTRPRPSIGADREHDRRVAIRERPLRRGDQALAEAPDLVVGDVRVGQVLQAGVDRAQHARDARRSVGGGLAEVVERDGVLEPEAARRRTHERAEVRPRPELLAEVASQGADVRPGGARRRRRPRSAARGRRRPTRPAPGRGSSRRAAASTTVSPERASWYARRPWIWTAL